MDKSEIKQRIEKLKEWLKKWNYNYFVLDKSDVSEAARDQIKKELTELEGQFPEFKAMNDDSGLLSIYINNRLIKTGADNWDQLSLNQDDEIALVIPIAGG